MNNRITNTEITLHKLSTAMPMVKKMMTIPSLAPYEYDSSISLDLIYDTLDFAKLLITQLNDENRFLRKQLGNSLAGIMEIQKEVQSARKDMDSHENN